MDSIDGVVSLYDRVVLSFNLRMRLRGLVLVSVVWVVIVVVVASLLMISQLTFTGLPHLFSHLQWTCGLFELRGVLAVGEILVGVKFHLLSQSLWDSLRSDKTADWLLLRLLLLLWFVDTTEIMMEFNPLEFSVALPIDSPTDSSDSRGVMRPTPRLLLPLVLLSLLLFTQAELAKLEGIPLSALVSLVVSPSLVSASRSSSGGSAVFVVWRAIWIISSIVYALALWFFGTRFFWCGCCCSSKQNRSDMVRRISVCITMIFLNRDLVVKETCILRKIQKCCQELCIQEMKLARNNNVPCPIVAFAVVVVKY